MYDKKTLGTFFYSGSSNHIIIKNSIFDNIKTNLPLIYDKKLRLQ